MHLTYYVFTFSSLFVHVSLHICFTFSQTRYLIILHADYIATDAFQNWTVLLCEFAQVLHTGLPFLFSQLGLRCQISDAAIFAIGQIHTFVT